MRSLSAGSQHAASKKRRHAVGKCKADVRSFQFFFSNLQADTQRFRGPSCRPWPLVRIRGAMGNRTPCDGHCLPDGFSPATSEATNQASCARTEGKGSHLSPQATKGWPEACPSTSQSSETRGVSCVRPFTMVHHSARRWRRRRISEKWLTELACSGGVTWRRCCRVHRRTGVRCLAACPAGERQRGAVQSWQREEGGCEAGRPRGREAMGLLD